MPTYCIARDPALYPSPLEFRPLRFYELRQRGPDEAKARHQLTSTGPTNLALGTAPRRVRAGSLPRWR